MSRKILLVTLLLWLCPIVAQGGMLIIQKNSSGTVTHWACEDGLFRMGTEDFYTITDANKQLIYTVMVKERQYTVTTAEEIRRQMEALQAQMSKMSALTNKFKGLGKFFGKKKEEEKAPEGPQITYKVTGKKATIAGYQTIQVLELENGQPSAELWVSEALARDVSQACDYRKLEKMMKAMFPEGKPSGPYAQGNQQGVIIKQGRVKGFPVKTVDLNEGEVVQIIKVEKKHLPRSYFQVPKGFSKVEYPQGMGQRPF